MVRTRQPTIDRAMVHIDEELDLIRTERDAFEAFLARLCDLHVDEFDTTKTGGSHTAIATVQSSPSTEFREIRQAYRETVMGVSHYDQEYADTLRESLTAELGKPLADHVVDGQILTPTVHDSLVEATKRTRDDRDEFIDHLHREHDSISTIADELNRIEARVVELGGRIDTTDTSADLSQIDETLQTLEERCTSLVASRQDHIQSRGNQKLAGLNSVSLSQYLYDDMDTVTPAIADIVSCLDTIRYERTRCLR